MLELLLMTVLQPLGIMDPTKSVLQGGMGKREGLTLWTTVRAGYASSKMRRASWRPRASEHSFYYTQTNLLQKDRKN